MLDSILTLVQTTSEVDIILNLVEKTEPLNKEVQVADQAADLRLKSLFIRLHVFISLDSYLLLSI